MTKEEFREQLGEHLYKDGVAKQALMGTEEGARRVAVNHGLRDGWLCSWPDCCNQEFGCGTRYGCALVPERQS